MELSVRVFLDREIGVASQEVPIEWAALAIRQICIPIAVLRIKHLLGSQVLWLVNHGGERLQVRTVVPCVTAAPLVWRHQLGKYEACKKR